MLLLVDECVGIHLFSFGGGVSMPLLAVFPPFRHVPREDRSIEKGRDLSLKCIALGSTRGNKRSGSTWEGDS
jgi:hypothetical protein